MKHPFQQILTGNSGEQLFTATKNLIQVFDLNSGNLIGHWKDELDTTATLKKQQQEKIKLLQETQVDEISSKKQKTNGGSGIKVPKIPVPGEGAPPIYNHIRALAISNDDSVLVGTTDSDKSAIMFKLDFSKENCLSLMKRQPFPKRPCAISIDQENVILADKFGDVYSIKIDDEKPKEEKEMVPILGHVSMLSDVIVAQLGERKFILTSDRDEHIRVSNYPKSYVIKDWLFGHQEFVSELHVPEFDNTILISGGGDDYFAMWKWHENRMLSKVDLRDKVGPFLDDSHLPPERFLTESSRKEISVKRILSYKDSQANKFLLVLCENTTCVLVYELRENYEVCYKQTLCVTHKIIDISLEKRGGNIFCGVNSIDNLLISFQINGDSEIVTSEDQNVMKSISGNSQSDIATESEVQPLYTINSLRKRSDH